MGGSAWFWVGLILGIPLSILANLLTPALRAWFERRSNRRSIKRTRQATKEYEKIKSFVEDRQRYHEYLLGVVIKTTFIGAIVGAVVSLLFTAPVLLPVLSPPNGVAFETKKVEEPKTLTREVNSQGEEVVTEVSKTTEIQIPRTQGTYLAFIVLTAGAQLFALMGAVMVAAVAGDGLRTIIRVSNFASYERNIIADG